MEKAVTTVCAIAIAASLGLSACSDDTLDPVVVFDLEPVVRQPWTASGELVDAGQMCPAGDRQNVGLAFPDGSPMTVEELMSLFEAAWDAGSSPKDVPRIGWEEHLCSDGSGTFTLRDEYREDSIGEPPHSEVVSGTGAYVNMTGTCVTVLTESEDRSELLEVIATCEFDMGTGE